MIGIGIDTGGTCTDAVVYDLDKKKILAYGKSRTTHGRLEEGIREALVKLPRECIDKAKYLSLSTTLATNACVENKGGRVCLIFIGVKKKTLEETYKNYGFEGTDFMQFLSANPKKGEEPDWEQLEAMLPAIVSAYDSIAVAQIDPMENGGAYEKEARRRIQSQCSLPVVCAYEIFQELNVIKRGAGAYLNARLIPVVQDFLKAVKSVLKEEGIALPVVIMRSDGSLVSEQYSKQFPVETLLCGPTASVKGGMELFEDGDALIVDMGGTTTDIAMIRRGAPLLDEEGVRVADWQTFVRGFAIDTFSLGGDSQVCYGLHSNTDNSYRKSGLYLGSQRVVPITFLAEQYAGIMTELSSLARRLQGSAKPLYEHLLLVRGIQEETKKYTEREIEICRLLYNTPLSIRQLAEYLGIDVYMLDTSRLESEGILQRSGLTPTDIMVLQGDFKGHSSKAVLLVLQFLTKCVQIRTRNIAAEVYQLVKERLYENLVRIMWNREYCQSGNCKLPENLREFARWAYQGWQDGEHQFFYNGFTTQAVLIGTGAPIHIFLPDVAAALHTTCRLSEYSGVSNALGAMLGDVCVYETIKIKVEYVISNWDTEKEEYKIYADTVIVLTDYDKALEKAGQIAEKRAREKAAACGAGNVYEVTKTIRRHKGETNLGEVLMGADVTVRVRGYLV